MQKPTLILFVSFVLSENFEVQLYYSCWTITNNAVITSDLDQSII